MSRSCEAFRVGTIAMGWDVGRGRAMIETRSVVEDDEDPPEVEDDDPDGPDLVRVFLDAPAVYAFARRRGPGRGRRPAAVPHLRRAARSAGPPLPAAQRVRALSDAADREPIARVLREGALELDGRLVDASNASFVGFARLDLDPSSGTAAMAEVRCVYKPIAGEAPLWDFPDGTLAHREVAAYLVSGGGRLACRARHGLPRRRPVRRRHGSAVDRGR